MSEPDNLREEVALTDAQRELLADKYVLWERASREGPDDLRDYNRRAADALKTALALATDTPALSVPEGWVAVPREVVEALGHALRLCVQRIKRPNLSPDANVVLERAEAALSALPVRGEGSSTRPGPQPVAQATSVPRSLAQGEGDAASRLCEAIAAEARRYAEMYPQSSDGRNTFVIFSEWVEGLASSAHIPGHGDAQ